MKSRDFCYWLQGYFEIRAANHQSEDSITPVQIEVITRHLNMVFKHEIDPSVGSVEHQKELDDIHEGEDSIAGASTLEPQMPPHIAIKFLELQEEMDKKIEELRKTTGWNRRPPGSLTMRC